MEDDKIDESNKSVKKQGKPLATLLDPKNYLKKPKPSYSFGLLYKKLLEDKMFPNQKSCAGNTYRLASQVLMIICPILNT